MEYAIPFFVVLVSSLWAAADASKNRVSISSGKEYASGAPAIWFICCVAIWIIAFPFYIIRRSDTLRAASASGASTSLNSMPTGGSRYCPKCGMALPAQAAFCSRCGSEQ